MPKFLALLALLLTLPCFAQDRFPSGELKGFKESSTEHIINYLDKPIIVSAVRGTVTLRGHEVGLEGVIFEIRGPGSSERIIAAKSDNKGHFEISHVREGAYTFKATKNGFQSVVGTLTVSKKADRQSTVTIEMPLGV
jgi:hypothetical protein